MHKQFNLCYISLVALSLICLSHNPTVISSTQPYKAHCLHLQPHAQNSIYFNHKSFLYTFRRFTDCRYATCLYWCSAVRCDYWCV